MSDLYTLYGPLTALDLPQEIVQGVSLLTFIDYFYIWRQSLGLSMTLSYIFNLFDIFS